MRLADRMARLGTETAFDVLRRAREIEAGGRRVVHLELGEPDFDTPAGIVDAAIDALHAGATHYGPAAGLPELRDAIAADSNARRGTHATAEMVVVTPGAKPILFFTILALVEPGDEVLCPDPGYPIYESMIRYMGGVPIPMRFRRVPDVALDVDRAIASIGPRTRLVILNSPHNPTGSMIPLTDLLALAATAARHGVPVLADEIYGQLVYQGRHVSIASLPGMEPLAIVLDGFSKTYAMTGWRIGYGVMPVPLARAVTKLQTNATSCTATFTQHAALAALRGSQAAVARMLLELRRRREVMVDGLCRIPGITCARPSGAFYAFPNVEGTGLSSRVLADRLLEEAGVACLAGEAFGLGGQGHLRLSYANSVSEIEEGLSRLRGFVTSARAHELAEARPADRGPRRCE